MKNRNSKIDSKRKNTGMNMGSDDISIKYIILYKLTNLVPYSNNQKKI